MGLYCQKSPPFGKTTSTMTCPAGYFKGAAKRCYKKCRAGYTNNGEFCGRGASTISLTRATCPSGKFRTGAYCYDQCPTGYSNSGLGKCVRLGTTLGLKSMSCKSDEHFDSGRCIKLPKVKIRGNTHLWVVNQAVNMLARSNDPLARRAANTMLEPTCALKWKEGLYDGDAKLADNPVKSSTSGTHFYNPVNKDWLGNYTKSTTYLMAGADASERVGSNLKTFNAPNAKQSAASRIKQVPATGPTASTGCYELGLALHYMTDMTQPMHTSSFSGASSPLWLHPYFEAYVPVVQARYPANLSWDQRWRGLSPDETFDKTSIRSNGLAPNLLKVLTVQGKKCTMQDADLSPLSYNGYCFVNDPKVDAQIGIVLKDGYQSTASYIYNVFNTF
jgi:phospholipase C